jgi:hypothetical protein
MVKEERDKNQLNLQHQAKKFEKEVQDLSEIMKDSKDKLQQSIQEKQKLQGELDNASEFQKKKMDAMHAKLGTIHILRKQFFSTIINLTSKIFTKIFFCQNKGVYFSTLHFDEIFML